MQLLYSPTHPLLKEKGQWYLVNKFSAVFTRVGSQTQSTCMCLENWRNWPYFQISWAHSRSHQKQGALWVTWYCWKSGCLLVYLARGLPSFVTSFTFWPVQEHRCSYCASQCVASPALKQSLVRHERQFCCPAHLLCALVVCTTKKKHQLVTIKVPYLVPTAYGFKSSCLCHI